MNLSLLEILSREKKIEYSFRKGKKYDSRRRNHCVDREKSGTIARGIVSTSVDYNSSRSCPK